MKRKPSTHPCPICGTKYPSQRLALHCVKPMCQEINRVPKGLAYEWRIQALPAAMKDSLPPSMPRSISTRVSRGSAWPCALLSIA